MRIYGFQGTVEHRQFVFSCSAYEHQLIQAQSLPVRDFMYNFYGVEMSLVLEDCSTANLIKLKLILPNIDLAWNDFNLYGRD